MGAQAPGWRPGRAEGTDTRETWKLPNGAENWEPKELLKEDL